ncbi:MAG: peroxiredoxin [Candidatus Kariarchaeaceae archaeon]|jgi:peroxiredoxin Q/BCP
MAVGDLFPDFELSNHKGEIVTLSDLKGKPFVVFSYPRAMTPGCTKEVCSVRDYFKELNDRGVIPFGLSNDNPTKNKKFADKHDLQYDLLCDENNVLLTKLGAYGEKKIYGRTSMGTFRQTWIVDNTGTLRKIFKKVNTSEHGTEIIQALDDLNM